MGSKRGDPPASGKPSHCAELPERPSPSFRADADRRRPASGRRDRRHGRLFAQRPAGRMATSGPRLRQHPLQSPGPDHHRQRRPTEGRLVLFRRHPLRPRVRAAGGGKHALSRHPLPQCRLRLRPFEARHPDQVDLSAQPPAGRRRQGLLRRGQPRPRLCGRQTGLHPARRGGGGGERRYRQAGLAHAPGRPRRDGDDHHHVAAGGGQDGAGRRQRRRDGRPGPAHRARPRERQGALARLQHRAGRRGEDRSGLPGALCVAGRQGPRRFQLASRRLAARRRHGLGLDLL